MSPTFDGVAEGNLTLIPRRTGFNLPRVAPEGFAAPYRKHFLEVLQRFEVDALPMLHLRLELQKNRGKWSPEVMRLSSSLPEKE